MAIGTAYLATSADSGGRNSPADLSFDAKSGQWVPVSADTGSNDSAGASPSAPPPDPNSGTQVNSQIAADKEYIEIEFNTLTGELVLTPTEKSIRIKVNDTVKIEGLGKYLSGLYFVSAIRRTLNKENGYSHTMTLMKNGFGGSVKEEPEQTETRAEEVPKETPENKSGDTVKIVGDNAVYSNASDGVKVPAWVKQKSLTVAQVSADGARVLVQPINSWVYAKYIQKV